MPLIDGERFEGNPGWCTYPETLDDAADVEWIGGGVNSKHPRASAIWRQGWLLHFGFEPAPDALNANGKALLVNAICYAAQFREDEPLGVTPSPFTNPQLPRSRHYLRLAIDAKEPDAKVVLANFAPALQAKLAAFESPALVGWCREHLGHLRAGPGGRLVVDEDARALGAEIGSRAGVERAVWAMGEETHRERAARALARLLPHGPGAEASPAVWKEWWGAHGDFVFFSEYAGQVWLLDPLAKARGVPSAELRGPKRASPSDTRHRR